MKMHSIAVGIVVFLVLSCNPVWAATSLEGVSVDDRALLQEVLDGNKASRDLPAKYRMRYQWTYEMPLLEGLGEGGDLLSNRTDSGTSTLFVDGARKHLKVNGGGIGHDGTRPVILLEEAFMTGSSFCHLDLSPGTVNVCHEWARPSDTAAQAEFDARVAGSLGQNLLRYGLGAGDEYLQDAVLMHPDVIRWKARRAEGGLIVVERHIPVRQPEGKPDTVYTIDPAAGYLITQVTAYEPNCEVWLEISVTPRQLPGGKWVPASIREVRSGIVSQFEIQELEFDPVIGPGVFTWEGVDTDISVFTCIRTDAAGGVLLLRHDGSGFNINAR